MSDPNEIQGNFLRIPNKTIKEIKDYRYSQKKGFSIGFKYSYPVYEVNRP